MTVLSNKIAEELVKIQELVNRTNDLLLLIDQLDDVTYLDGLASGLALYLQNFYTGIERIFSLIAKELDGSIPSSMDWHLQLLRQLLVEVPDVRPAVISQETYEELNKFRGFRHISRNLYAYNLDYERIVDLANQLVNCHQMFLKDMEKLDVFLVTE